MYDGRAEFRYAYARNNPMRYSDPTGMTDAAASTNGPTPQQVQEILQAGGTVEAAGYTFSGAGGSFTITDSAGDSETLSSATFGLSGGGTATISIDGSGGFQTVSGSASGGTSGGSLGSGSVNGGSGGIQASSTKSGGNPSSTPIMGKYLLSNPVAEQNGVDAILVSARTFQSIKSKHGPATNRQNTSIFDSQFVDNFGNFADKILNPALESPLAIVRTIPGAQLQWTATLPYNVGMDLNGLPTSSVTIVMKLNIMLSVQHDQGIYNITGAYPQ